MSTMPKQKPVSVAAKRSAIAIAVVAGIGTWVGLKQSGALATPPPPSAPATAPATAPALPASPEPTAPATAEIKNTAQIVFTTVPPSNATVTWGNTRLGRITPRQPLIIIRPRDSGPLDVVVRAPGYLPVQTRAHTFADTKVQVKLTPPDQKSTLLGYRQPIDAGTPISEDGGVPPTLSDMPPPLQEAPLSPYNSTSPVIQPAPPVGP